MSINKLALAALLVCLGSPAVAGPLTVVVPNAQTSEVGNAADSIDTSGPVDVRYQQIYGGGQFLSLGLGSPLLIDQIAFRAYPGRGALNVTIADLKIYLSTTQYYPNLNGGPDLLITNNFETNLGPDNTLVYEGPGGFNSPGCADGSTPCPFDMVFNLITPFLYDPTKGRLLMDFQATGLNGPPDTGALDSQDFNGFPVPYGSVANVAGGLEDSTGEFSPSGEITQFRYTAAVPEPASLTLLLTGVGLAGAMRRRRRIERRRAK